MKRLTLLLAVSALLFSVIAKEHVPRTEKESSYEQSLTKYQAVETVASSCSEYQLESIVAVTDVVPSSIEVSSFVPFHDAVLPEAPLLEPERSCYGRVIIKDEKEKIVVAVNLSWLKPPNCNS